MKLYYSKGACSLAVRIIINELNLPCDFVAVNLKTKETEQGEDFLKINPKGAVPTLETNNNDILTENAVIQQYLADENNATTLLPAIKTMPRYEVLTWLNYITTELHKGFGPFFSPFMPDEMKQTFFRPMLNKKFDYVNNCLTGKEYLAADHFTLPDAYLFVIMTWMPKFKFELKTWPNIEALFERLKNRDSVKKSLEQEGLAY